MALPPKPYSLPSPQGLPEETRKYLDTLSRGLNPFIKDVAEALNKGLGLEANVNSKVKQIQINIPEHPWNTVSAFEASVSNYSTQPCQYRAEPSGVCRLMFWLNCPAGDPSSLFTLPEGYRPTYDFRAAPDVIIYSTGVVQKTGTGTTVALNTTFALAPSTSTRILPFSAARWPIIIDPQIQGRPIAVIPLLIQDLDAPSIDPITPAWPDWSYTGDNLIQIKRWDGLTPGHNYLINLLFLGQ